MILRFSSGSVTPASAPRKRSAASTCTSACRGAAEGRRRTRSASPARSRPLSTKMQVSWSPTARWTSAATTAESTPPESAQMHPPVADLARMPSIACVDEDSGGPVAGAAADVVQEVARSAAAEAGVHDLGMELDADHAVRRSPSRRWASCRGGGERSKPGGSASTGRRGSSRPRTRRGSPREERLARRIVDGRPPGRTRAWCRARPRRRAECASSCMP